MNENNYLVRLAAAMIINSCTWYDLKTTDINVVEFTKDSTEVIPFWDDSIHQNKFEYYDGTYHYNCLMYQSFIYPEKFNLIIYKKESEYVA